MRIPTVRGEDADGHLGTIFFHRVFGLLKETSISLCTTGSTAPTNPDATMTLHPDHDGNGAHHLHAPPPPTS